MLRHDAITFACNAVFLHTAACFQYGQNGALWSLFNEFWYYAAWPAVMIAFWGNVRLQTRVVLVILALTVLVAMSFAQFVGPNVALYFSIWLLGAVAIQRNRLFVGMRPSIAAVILLVAVALWRVTATGNLWNNHLVNFPKDLLIAFLFVNLIMNMRCRPGLPYPPVRKLHGFLSGFSFTLFATHTPVIHCFCAFLLWAFGTGWNMMPVGLLPFAIFAATAAACVCAAFLVSLATERHTAEVRELLRSSILRCVRPAVPRS